MNREEFKKVEGLKLQAVEAIGDKPSGIFIEGITAQQVIDVFSHVRDSIHKTPVEVPELKILCDLIERSVNGPEMLQVTSDQWRSHCRDLKDFMLAHGCRISLRPIE